MSNPKSNKKEIKNVKALFSIICLCIISLGLIVYFSTSTQPKNDTVNEHTTLEETTEVQHAVTLEDTTRPTKPTTQPSTHAKPSTTKEPSTMPLSKSNTPYKSYYKYPIGEAVQKGYSETLTHSKTMNDYRSHAAVDFTAEDAENVVAINDGLVLDVYDDAMLGLTVEIDHGGKLVAKYSGLASASVKKGDLVDIGNKVGTVGVVPCERDDAPHLHLSCKLNGKTVNPLDVMSKTE